MVSIQHLAENPPFEVDLDDRRQVVVEQMGCFVLILIHQSKKKVFLNTNLNFFISTQATEVANLTYFLETLHGWIENTPNKELGDARNVAF